ncbi:RNA-binding protein 33-like [Sycon ciliatum]|uniref:RNA-binding protein 33-like n=1 Tax=Sycon ciliatum TaxID=27933 RepID=UPI0031F60C62
MNSFASEFLNYNIPLDSDLTSSELSFASSACSFSSAASGASSIQSSLGNGFGDLSLGPAAPTTSIARQLKVDALRRQISVEETFARPPAFIQPQPCGYAPALDNGSLATRPVFLPQGPPTMNVADAWSSTAVATYAPTYPPTCADQQPQQQQPQQQNCSFAPQFVPCGPPTQLSMDTPCGPPVSQQLNGMSEFTARYPPLADTPCSAPTASLTAMQPLQLQSMNDLINTPPMEQQQQSTILAGASSTSNMSLGQAGPNEDPSCKSMSNADGDESDSDSDTSPMMPTCRYHPRLRKTRLRPENSLLTGKRKYRCEMCTMTLEAWVTNNGTNPDAPSKTELLAVVGMTRKQLNYWFANRRRMERQAAKDPNRAKRANTLQRCSSDAMTFDGPSPGMMPNWQGYSGPPQQYLDVSAMDF